MSTQDFGGGKKKDIKPRGKEKEGRKEVYVVSVSMHI